MFFDFFIKEINFEERKGDFEISNSSYLKFCDQFEKSSAKNFTLENFN